MQTLPPFAVPPVVFQFRALATLAGRLPLGGQREIVLAVLLAARLGRDAMAPSDLLAAARRVRAARARSWYASLALPPIVRSISLRVVQASETGSLAEFRLALGDMLAQIADHLDGASRSELKRLLLALAEDS